jgi:hypothetical protein
VCVVPSKPKAPPLRLYGLCAPGEKSPYHSVELELELTQAHITQKPLLWKEVGAHAVRKRAECTGVVWAGAGVALSRGACVCVAFEAFYFYFYFYLVGHSRRCV